MVGGVVGGEVVFEVVSEFVLFITRESFFEGAVEFTTGLIGGVVRFVEFDELLFSRGRTGRSIGILTFKHFFISWLSMKPSMHSVHYCETLFHCVHVSLFKIKFPFSKAK